MNYTEIGFIAASNKLIVRTAIERVLYNLAEQARQSGRFLMEIPHVGLLVARKNVVGVKFKDHLIQDTRVFSFRKVFYT